MQKIIPHLWFDTQAKEAAEFYVSVFEKDSEITNINTLRNTPSGDCDLVSFKLWDYEFEAISAGPYFKFNPSISFMINFDPSQDKEAAERLEKMWKKLMEGGKALMPLDKYDFSERYGWVQDKFGLSWQLILTNPEGEERPLILPSIMFTKDVSGKAEEASDFYLSVFKETKRGALVPYPPNTAPDESCKTMFTDFKLEGQWFVAMDSGKDMHHFTFNEAVSFIVNCDTQKEIDHYWEKLSAVPEAERCGWIKDKYGLSWQIVPTKMQEMMKEADPETLDQLTQAFLKMKKFDLAKLEEIYNE